MHISLKLTVIYRLAIGFSGVCVMMVLLGEIVYAFQIIERRIHRVLPGRFPDPFNHVAEPFIIRELVRKAVAVIPLKDRPYFAGDVDQVLGPVEPVRRETSMVLEVTVLGFLLYISLFNRGRIVRRTRELK